MHFFFFKDAIGQRLQEERKRLGLNQEDFAKAVGVAKRTLAGYEGGAADVGASVLGQASELGVDVLYVVQGKRTPTEAASFSAAEAELVAHYRELAPTDQASAARMISALADMVRRA